MEKSADRIFPGTPLVCFPTRPHILIGQDAIHSVHAILECPFLQYRHLISVPVDRASYKA